MNTSSPSSVSGAGAPLTAATLQAALAEYFAPWVQALGLEVVAFERGQVTLRLPQNEGLSRVGGMLCGQAMMAAADTAMVLAVMTELGGFRPITLLRHKSPASGRGSTALRQLAKPLGLAS